jgi:flagellar motility protein MotE (MotC chaperone)
MSKLLREFRLIPIVLTAVGCLLVLKVMGILLDGGYTLGPRFAGGDTLVVTKGPATPAAALRPQAATPTAASIRASDPEVTGSAGAAPAATPAPPKDAKAERGSVPAPYDPNARGTRIPLDTPSRPPSAAERALLERLQERRQELDARARELDVRESLLAAAEKKLEGRTAEQGNDGKGGAGGRKDSPDARFKSVVTMYETMKPKDAAKIFDRLDIRVLLDVASQINPRVMSAILAQMSPEAAERLTVELTARGSSDRAINPNDLPKIEGRPTN